MLIIIVFFKSFVIANLKVVQQDIESINNLQINVFPYRYHLQSP